MKRKISGDDKIRDEQMMSDTELCDDTLDSRRHHGGWLHTTYIGALYLSECLLRLGSGT